MLPVIRQRLIVAIAIVLGAMVWLHADSALAAGDGSSGYALTSAGGGTATALVMVIVMGLPTIIMGATASSLGNPLSGLFVVCGALLVVAWAGGPIDGWLHRSAAPGSYGGLILEMLIWAGFLLLVTWIMHVAHRKLGPLVPRSLHAPHAARHETRFALPKSKAWMAGLITIIIGGGLSYFDMRNSNIGQVTIGLLLAFAAAAMAAQLAMPQDNPLPILFAPVVVAVLAYGYVMMRYESYDQVIAAWYAIAEASPRVPRLPGLALGLPIHYISAGVAGCALGLGWAQSIIHGEQGQQVDTSATAAPSDNGKDEAHAAAR